MRRRLVLCGLLLALAGCFVPPTEQQILSADCGAYPENYQQIVQAYYSTVLFDPYSAVYQFGPARRGYGYNNFQLVWGYVVEGNVNAKNRFGGYVGAAPFAFLIRNGQLIAADALHYL